MSGDSRIRAPYKDRWKRNLLRVKGGNHDYCITGEIDVQALRRFQSNHRSPDKPFNLKISVGDVQLAGTTGSLWVCC